MHILLRASSPSSSDVDRRASYRDALPGRPRGISPHDRVQSMRGADDHGVLSRHGAGRWTACRGVSGTRIRLAPPWQPHERWVNPSVRGGLCDDTCSSVTARQILATGVIRNPTFFHDGFNALPHLNLAGTVCGPQVINVPPSRHYIYRDGVLRCPPARAANLHHVANELALHRGPPRRRSKQAITTMNLAEECVVCNCVEHACSSCMQHLIWLAPLVNEPDLFPRA